MFQFIGMYIHTNRRIGAIIKCSLQTDFAARTDIAKDTIDFFAKIACGYNCSSVEDFIKIEETPKGSIQSIIENLKQQLGEKFSIDEIVIMECK